VVTELRENYPPLVPKEEPLQTALEKLQKKDDTKNPNARTSREKSNKNQNRKTFSSFFATLTDSSKVNARGGLLATPTNKKKASENIDATGDGGEQSPTNCASPSFSQADVSRVSPSYWWWDGSLLGRVLSFVGDLPFLVNCSLVCRRWWQLTSIRSENANARRLWAWHLRNPKIGKMGANSPYSSLRYDASGNLHKMPDYAVFWRRCLGRGVFNDNGQFSDSSDGRAWWFDKIGGPGTQSGGVITASALTLPSSPQSTQRTQTPSQRTPQLAKPTIGLRKSVSGYVDIPTNRGASNSNLSNGLRGDFEFAQRFQRSIASVCLSFGRPPGLDIVNATCKEFDKTINVAGASQILFAAGGADLLNPLWLLNPKEDLGSLVERNSIVDIHPFISRYSRDQEITL
tara:strand:- start:223 stop:1428 length:1206 start_codon:yes stop_codon:yes gene_type:complete